jgi:ligand-binding sensor domain-containing protein
VLKVAPDGSLYVGAENGVLRYRADKWETLADVVRDFGEFVPFTIAFDMAIAENGDLWVGGVHNLARFDGQTWTEYDVNVRRLLIAPDGSLWGEGWDGISGSDCCFVHLTGDGWVTYTHSADLPVSQALRSEIHDLMR